MGKKILVDLPEEEERLCILMSCLCTPVTNPPPVERLREVARETRGYSGSDLTHLCREATLSAMRRTSEDTQLEITMDLLMEARQLVKPSPSSNSRKFAEWNKNFGSY